MKAFFCSLPWARIISAWCPRRSCGQAVYPRHPEKDAENALAACLEMEDARKCCLSQKYATLTVNREQPRN
ncbi:MAG: hypothetical protein R2875_18075 [Desulfobacterales bacterium]